MAQTSDAGSHLDALLAAQDRWPRWRRRHPSLEAVSTVLLRTYWDALDLFDTTDKESPVPLIEDDGSNLSTRCRPSGRPPARAKGWSALRPGCPNEDDMARTVECIAAN